MSPEQLSTITAIEQFLGGTQAVAFGVLTTKKERDSWIQKTLVKHQYIALGKADKGVMTRYLMKVTGYSLAQIKRLIQQYAKTGTVKAKLARQNGFKRTYTEADIRLLASMDERHSQIINQATYVPIQYIRGVRISAKGSTMSTQWMRSPSFKSSSRWSALARRSCYLPCIRCLPDSPLK